MQSYEAILSQRVNSPLKIRNLDATKIQTRPPSQALNLLRSRGNNKTPYSEVSHYEKLYSNDETKEVLSITEDAHNVRIRKLDVLKRDDFFRGNLDVVNANLGNLVNIGRCDLYPTRKIDPLKSLLLDEQEHESLINIHRDGEDLQHRNNGVSKMEPTNIGSRASSHMMMMDRVGSNNYGRNAKFDGTTSRKTNHGTPIQGILSQRYLNSDGSPISRITDASPLSMQSSGTSRPIGSRISVTFKDRIKNGSNNSGKKTANQDLKMLALYMTPELKQIEEGKIDIPLNKYNLDEIINKLDDIEGITHRRYCRAQLNRCKPFIKDIFWYIYLNKFYKHSKNRTQYLTSDVTKTMENLLLSIAEKFVHMVAYSETKISLKEGNKPTSSNKIPSNYKRNPHVHFFRQMSTLLSLIVYSAFCHSWKDSWNNFVDPSFRQYLMDTLSTWIDGIRNIPGRGEYDPFWRRVEPFLLRQDKSRTDKDSSSKSVADYFSNTLGSDNNEDGNTEDTASSRWDKGFNRVTLMNKLGGKLSEQAQRERKQTKTTRRMTLAITQIETNLKQMENESRSMMFESSRFNVNGRSPLFDLHCRYSYGYEVGSGLNTEILVSRRNCLAKKFWRDNPLEKKPKKKVGYGRLDD